MAKKIKVLNAREGYDLAAEVYDQRQPYLDSFEKGRLLPLLEDVKGKKVLDVGSGTGRLAVELDKKGAKVTALDASEKMLEVLSKKIKLKTVVGYAEELPFKDESFDIVIATFLVVHLKDPKCFFEEAYRVLKNDGILLVSNINQKEAPVVKTRQGDIKIESYYHRPDKIINMLADLSFCVKKEEIVKENEVWVNQIILAVK